MSEYKCMDGMIDNRKVKDNHQQGIERVKQRKGDTTRADTEGHQGKMGHKPRSDAAFKRTGGSLTPRKA